MQSKEVRRTKSCVRLHYNRRGHSFSNRRYFQAYYVLVDSGVISCDCITLLQSCFLLVRVKKHYYCATVASQINFQFPLAKHVDKTSSSKIARIAAHYSLKLNLYILSLQVSGLHKVYFEVCGNRDGKPVLVLHGGPGGGSQNSYRQ